MRSAAALFICFCVLTSCNEKIFTGEVNCDECYTEKPVNADLIIDLSVTDKYPAVPVVIYKGDVEKNDIVYVDTAFATPYYAFVPVNRKYSVKAEYRSGDDVVYAVDGTNLKVQTVTDACDESCYVIENETMDAKLKREFP